MIISVKLFGAFRPFGQQIDVTLNTDSPKVSDLRIAFKQALKQLPQGFDNDALLQSSRFADEQSVLAESAKLKSETVYAILPPVSGG
ncbi:MoaD/ThiS family protein [Paraferrimonas sp. SM1919]|uniref:MoaD/ThiS family protein n=1 Tax=Paraferrimonas sp. SM1919 TaxID=2662263 RepID=UPI0013D56853|nr:MoaD/ThiS family protein [Paraferrimonas sp. SM1919]